MVSVCDYREILDSKARVSLPREMLDMLGDTVELRAVRKQKVLISTTSKTKGKSQPRGNEIYLERMNVNFHEMGNLTVFHETYQTLIYKQKLMR